MRLAADPEALSWFDALVGAPNEVDWDTGNLSKNAKHGVFPADVEALLAADTRAFAGQIVEPPHNEPRWLALGRDATASRPHLHSARRETAPHLMPADEEERKETL
jgi:hypothetical protein